MRKCLLLVTLFAFHHVYSQQSHKTGSPHHCPRNSHLYQFDKNAHPRDFTEKLGAHPQFQFLQEINGISSPALFIHAIQDYAIRQKFAREFDAFDLLLHNSGFTNGYKDLNTSNVRNVFIPPGTIGNLGFYNPQKDLMSYNYVELEPAGESSQGIAAWKLTTHSGCFLYILHTCGNAFYPNEGAVGSHSSGGGGHDGGGRGDHDGGGHNGYENGRNCCKTLSVDARVDTVEWRTSGLARPLHVQVNFYEAILVPASRHKTSGSGGSSTGASRDNSSTGYDTVVTRVRHLDTLGSLSYAQARQWKVYGIALRDKIMICRDSSLKLYTRLLVDSGGPADRPDEISFTVSDTNYIRRYVAGPVQGCSKKWEIALDGGMSFNSIPRFNSPTVHSQTDGNHLAGELAISRILSRSWQVGVSAAYITLAYLDDVAYPGTVPGTYNRVTLGKPIIPVQLFAKATIGGPLGWQSNIILSAGYSIPMNGVIDDAGNTLTTKPSVQGGPTAGVRLGLAYFFSCKFGLGLSAGGQYFSNRSALQHYSLWAMPIMGGIRVRF